LSDNIVYLDLHDEMHKEIRLPEARLF